MHKIAILALITVLAPQVATAHAVRHHSMPEAYWGTWALDAGPCKDADDSAIVLSANAYAGPAGKCAIEYVTETPGPHGAIYSARMQCSSPGPQSQKKTIANLVIRSDNASQISAGPTFDSLKTYHRCSSVGPGTKG